jgi:predicted metal-dependent hydrolase
MFSFFKSNIVKENPIILGQGEDLIKVYVKISSKAKLVKIKISIKNTVELVLPKNADFNTAYKFVVEKEKLIRERLRKLDHLVEIKSSPKNISILGKEYQIITNDNFINIPIKIDGDKILISHVISKEKHPSIISTLLKKIAKVEITHQVNKICEYLGLKYNKISVKDMSSRWGSCSQDKNLSFSWRLVLAPREVMEYVVVHEVCHLVEMNHSSRFWNLVHKTYPDYFAAKLWLKKNGRYLHNLI